VQRWASASADFARRHNPVNPIVHSRTVTRLKGWRPFNREGQQASYKDEATSTKGDGDNDSGLSQLEGGMGQLVHYLMPQVFIVAIFRKAQQVHAVCFCTCKCMLPIPDPNFCSKSFHYKAQPMHELVHVRSAAEGLCTGTPKLAKKAVV